MARLLFIVAQDRADLFDYLTQEVSGEKNVQVVLDRRRGARRQRVQQHEPNRRRHERRQADTDDAIRSHGFVLIRQQEDKSSDWSLHD